MKKTFFSRLTAALLLLITTGLLQTAQAQQFVHPGVLHTESDLNRIRDKANGTEEPWKTAYAVFRADKMSNVNYIVNGPFAEVERGKTSSLNRGAFQQDSTAAYQNALMWVITGNQAHANKAIQIIDGYSSTLQRLYGEDVILMAGSEGWKYAAAGEILRWHNDPTGTGAASGWSPAGIASAQNMLRNVFLPHLDLSNGVDGNWGTMCMKSLIAVGVFNEDRALYDSTVNIFQNYNSCPQRIAVTGYILPTGQNGESGRDQGHSQGGVAHLAEVAETGWAQGQDLYSHGDNRLLTGFEYAVRYNYGYDNLPFQTFGTCVNAYSSISPIDRGQFTRMYEMVYNHYAVRRGLAAPYMQQAIQRRLWPETGPLPISPDNPGWGTLLFYSGPAVTFTPTLADGVYKFISEDNGLALGVQGGSLAHGANTVAYPYTGQQDAKWQLTHVGLGLYSVINVNSGKALEIPSANMRDGASVTQANINNGIGQKWRILSNADGSFAILNYNSARAVEIPGGRDDYQNNIALQQMLPSSVSYQKWWPSAPDAPLPLTGLKATPGDEDVSLTWNAPSDASAYNVKRSTTPGGPYITIAAGVAGTSYVDTGLTNGTTYYYVVSALGTAGETADSAEASATPLSLRLFTLIQDSFAADSATVTDRIPQEVTIEGRAYQKSIATTANANTVSGGFAKLTTGIGELVPITSGGDYTKPARLHVEATFNMGTLTNNSPLRVGRGVYVGFWSAVPVSGEPFGNMRGVVINPEDGELHLWNGGNSSTSTPAQSLPYNGTWVGGTQSHTVTYTVNTATGDIFDFKLDGVAYDWNTTNIFTDANTAYAGFGVSAAASGNFGNIDSFKLSGNIPPPPTPTRPTTLSAVVGDGQIILNWTASSDALNYNVKRSTTPGGSYATVKTGVAATSYTDTGLVNGTTYYYVVSAANETGESANSAEVHAAPRSTPLDTLIQDTFTTASTTVTGRIPQEKTIEGHVYQRSITTTANANSVSGGFARLTTGIGEVIPVTSSGAYTKPTRFKVEAAFNMGTLGNNSPTRVGRGVFVGVWSAIPTANEPYTNMRGVFVNPEDGELHLWNGSNSSTGTPSQTLAYNGDWVGGTQPHTLTYTIDTSTGDMFDFVLDGVAYDWAPTTIFSNANTAFAGFGVSAAVAGQVGNIDSFKVSGNTSAADANAPVINSPDGVLTQEATGPNGAIVNFDASATDLTQGNIPVTVAPPSGSTFPLGETLVTVTAKDATGNETAKTFTVSVVDTTAPVITPPVLAVVEATGPDGAQVSFGDEVGSPVGAFDAVSLNVPVAYSHASGSTFPIGTTLVTMTASDAAGNTATATFDITVADTAAPVVNIADVTVEATSAAGAAATYEATASDAVNGQLPVTFSIPSGSTYPLGDTLVTATATDFSGNAATATFTVTVRDSTAPSITPVADIVLEAEGSAGSVVTYTASASDLVDGNTAVSFSHTSGRTFPLGTTTVTITATDAAGNTATSTFTVTVRDTTKPTLMLPANLTLEATGAAGAVATFTASASDSVSGNLPVSFSQAPGSTFAFGTTTVTASATDAAGNAVVGTFTVTVVDTTGPVFQSLTASPDRILQKNHMMALVTLTANVVDVAGPVTTSIVSVTSNEPVNGTGDGDTSPDWEITGAMTLNLRAERAGSGSGRVYTITVESRDDAGNQSLKTVTVVVPH